MEFVAVSIVCNVILFESVLLAYVRLGLPVKAKSGDYTNALLIGAIAGVLVGGAIGVLGTV